MKNVELNKRVEEMCAFVKEHTSDDMSKQLKPFVDEFGGQAVFAYAHWCERNFELNLRKDYKRKTTYTSDFSIAEWCVGVEGMESIADTLRNALVYWHDSIEFLAEIIIVLNLKSWEHGARGNYNYSQMYGELYLEAKCLYFDWFDNSHPKHKKAMDYYYKYVD